MPPTTTQATKHPADLLRGVYTQPYNEIVHPGRVWTAGKYFLRRWSAYLTPPEMWLVIGARQLSYLNRRRSWFAAYDNTLADAAGLNVDVYRRTLKRAISDGEGYVAHFLAKDTDPAYVVRDDVPRKGRTRYTVRLDDPLTPADAVALAQWLQEKLSPDADGDAVRAVLQEARRLEPQSLWAQELGHDDGEQNPVAATVAAVVRRLLPHLEGDEGGWEAEADALQSHLVASEIVHLEPHYFREQWLPELGAGPALLIVTLRSLCYLNEDTGEIRDVINVEAHDLAQRLQTTTRTLRRWFNKLERAAAHDKLFGPFFTFLENSKQPDQKVIATYRINLKMPLTPADHARYLRTMNGNGQDPAAASPANGVADKKSAPAHRIGRRLHQKVPDKSSVTQATPAGVADKKSGTQHEVADISPATTRGHGQNNGNAERGRGQIVGGSQTKGRPFNYYQRLLTLLDLENLEQLEQRTEQQYQHHWHMRDGRAQEPFAAVGAGGSLSGLLDLLGIQEPARSRIRKGDPRLAEVLAWHLYARRQPSLDQPLGYIVSRLTGGDAPPQPFLNLATLSWEQWRTYAALAYLVPGEARDPALAGEMPCLSEWLALYGDVSPEKLPLGVGQGLLYFRIDLFEERRARNAPGEPRMGQAEVARTAPDDAPSLDCTLWQEALSELSLQMTQSTFDAWLRGTHLVDRDGADWTIGVATPAAQYWLESRLNHVVARTLGAVTGETASVHFVVR